MESLKAPWKRLALSERSPIRRHYVSAEAGPSTVFLMS